MALHHRADSPPASRSAPGVVTTRSSRRSGLLAHAAGEGWARALGRGSAPGLSGGALAFVALAASLAGAGGAALRSVGSRNRCLDDRRHPLMSGGALAAGAVPFGAAPRRDRTAT